MKDLFIDNCIAKNFSNPLDEEYKILIEWLLLCNENAPHDNAILVISNKLLSEYISTCGMAQSTTSIPVIVDKMTREGRIHKISNSAIKAFKRNHFSPRIIRRLRSNYEDKNHIPVVLLSHRKYALSRDDNLIYDLTHFPGYTVSVEKRPQDLPYKE